MLVWRVAQGGNMSKLKGVWDVLAVFHGGDDAAFRAMVVAVAALRKKTRSSAVVGKTRGKRRVLRISRSRSACRRLCRPAEGNEVERGGVGGRGANFEVVVVAGRGQRVVAVAALRKQTRSSAAGRADAGQTSRRWRGRPGRRLCRGLGRGLDRMASSSVAQESHRK